MIAVKLPTDCAGNIAAGYQKVQAAIEFFRAAKATPETHSLVKSTMLDVTTGLQLSLAKIDKRIPKQAIEQFNDQVKNNDSLRFEEITRLYHRLTPDQQELAEVLLNAILKGEAIQFQ